MSTTNIGEETRLSPRVKKSRGFSLLELLIALAIAGILAALAVPRYAGYVSQGRATEALSQLSIVALQLEQYYQDNRTYVGACGPGTVVKLPASKTFTFSCAGLTVDEFSVTATGKGSMAGFIFAIDQAGSRTTASLPGGWGTAPASCWISRRGESC